MDKKNFICPSLTVISLDFDEIICGSGPEPGKITRIDSGIGIGGSYDETL